jgi:Integrase zinc binding domain/Integrase core domain
MDLTEYQQLKQYITNQTLPENLKDKNRIKSKSKFFKVQDNLLYKIDRRKRTRGELIRVLQEHEIEPVLFMLHNHPLGGHLGVDIVFNKVRNLYFWPQMYDDIKDYIRSCDSCQRRGRKRNVEPLQPIPVGEPFSKMGIDIVGPLPLTDNGNKYIVVATDYMTKWPEARAIPQATAKQVASFIFEDIICRHGCPHLILSDRGSHFRNHVIDELMEEYKIKHIYSTPYHPATNGLVERFNRTLCESIAKTAISPQKWDENVSAVLFAYRTARQSTTKIEPFYLVYGRAAKFPLKRGLEIAETNLLTRLFTLVDELPVIRGQTQSRIKRQQLKQKEYHDRRIVKPIVYEIGNKVLLYEAAKQTSHTGKLDPKWKGPYYIHDLVYPGVYKLRTLDGKVLRTPINGSLLKLYNERSSWVPQIVITP